MLRVVYSNRTEELLSELAARVRAQQMRDGPLEPVRVVVPSASLEAYVRLGIARAQGIAANLEVAFLERFAAQVAAPAGARIADASSLAAMVLTLLLDDGFLAHADLAPVREYADADDVRRVQLAERVGRIFEEYGYSRAEMLAAWKGGGALDERHAETERWQRRLWLAMFGPGVRTPGTGADAHGTSGLASARAPRLVPLPEAVRDLAPDRAAAALPRAVHVFGFAHVARTFHELLARVAAAGEVVVYSLSPCEGFWEDVDARDPAPLHLWGRPGRENVRALNALAGFDHDDRFVDPLDEGGRRTLLHEVQSSILRRDPTPRLEKARDESVLVLEHASIRRECEAVASAIWSALREDASLRFDDVAVLVPPGDAAAYAPHLAAAFGEAHDLPWQAMGLPQAAPSRVKEALDLLLALPLGRFTRPEVLRLVAHPAVVAGMEGVDPQRWVAWCEALGVVHGADRADHAGTYIERDILNWDQGLRRLALGAFMAGDASGDGSPYRAGGEAYVPLEVGASEVHEAASFARLVRSLVEDARFARDAMLTTREWATLMRTMVETYVATPSEGDADELARWMRRIGAVGDVDLGGERVGYRVAHELARTRLSGGAARAGREGVVVSTPAAARAIPFRVVFACGMGEGRFPSADVEDPLDLRRAKRQQGDVGARDRDKYAFLDVLLGARDRLVLSYVSRDALTGDELAPSPVVLELLHAIGQAGIDPAALRRRHPLRRWDPAYFPDVFGGESAPLGTSDLPEARAEARALALRRSADRHGVRPGPGEVTARAEGGDPAWAALAEHLRLAALPPAPPLALGRTPGTGAAGNETDRRVVVPMHALVKFLELPLQGWARFRFGLEETESEDPVARDAEPFETDLREETLLLRDVALQAAAERRPVREVYDATVRDRELRGAGPSGLFARGERGDHLRALESWERALGERGVPFDSLELVRFGRAGERSRAARACEPPVVEVQVVDRGVARVVRAEIAGRTLPLGAGGRASVLLAKRANENRKDEWAVAGRKRAALRALVDHAVLAASGAAQEERAALVVVATAEEPVVETVKLPALPPDAARSWLRGLVEELLGAPHAYFLPCEAVFVHHARGGEGPFVPVLEEARQMLRGGDGPPALRSVYGPVPRPQDYPAPDEAEARAMIARRFALLLASPQEPS